jgi:hypothetical protein
MEELLAILLAQLALLMVERLIQYALGTIRATANGT